MDIKTFSRIAGVSTATISRAFNGTGRINAETRERVFKVAKEHGYTPNIHAQRLNLRKASIIGVYYSFSREPIFDYYHMELAQELAKAAAKQGYTIHLELAQNIEEPSTTLRRVVSGGGLDGLILVGDTREGAIELLKDFSGCPCVVIANRSWDLPEAAGLVCLNQDAGIQEAVDRFVALGHKRIGYIRGDSGGVKYEAFVKAMKSHRMPVPASHVAEGPTAFHNGERAIGELLSAGVTAVLCSTDILALGAISGAAARGVIVPRDLSVVGIDNLAFTAFTLPALASIGIPRREIAEAAVSIIHQISEAAMNKDTRSPARQYVHSIHTRLIERASLGVAPAAA